MRFKPVWLSFALLVSLAPAAGQDEKGVAPEDHIGDLFLYRMDRVVIVYPAGPGEDVEVNRRSAQARANFLEKSHGIKVSVVADDKAGVDDLAENLLVLGWSNRVLGTETATRPFLRTESGLQFLGIDESDPRADLELFSVNPYSPGKALIFWSRIDPERDRFTVLPTTGSDWAILRDCTVLKQGMFKQPLTWPPAREPGAEMDHVPHYQAADARERLDRTAHYDVRRDPSLIGDEEAAAIGKAREAALGRAAAALGVAVPDFRITLRVFGDEKTMAERIGLPDLAVSFPWNRELDIARRVARSGSSHEEVHLLARQVLGPCYVSALYEGLALSVEGSYRGTPLEVLVAAMSERKSLPRVADLLDEEKFRALPDETRLPAAGMLISWIRANGDRDTLTRAYTIRDGALASLAVALRKPADSLEGSFSQWADAQVRLHHTDVEFAKARSEAAERHKAGDYPGVVKAMERALKAKPDDPQTLFNLASAEMRVRSYPSAESHLRRLLSLSLDPADSYFVSFGHYQLGRLFDVQGRRDDALQEYRKVLELPDRHDAHRLAREAIDRPVTEDQLD